MFHNYLFCAFQHIAPVTSNFGCHKSIPVPPSDPTIRPTAPGTLLDLIRCFAGYNDFNGLLYERPSKGTDELYFPGTFHVCPIIYYGNRFKSL